MRCGFGACDNVRAYSEPGHRPSRLPFWLTPATVTIACVVSLSTYPQRWASLANLRIAVRRCLMVRGRELRFPEPSDVSLHRLARDRAARRPLKDLFEGIRVGLLGIWNAIFQLCSGGYFQVLGIRFLDGRPFTRGRGKWRARTRRRKRHICEKVFAYLKRVLNAAIQLSSALQWPFKKPYRASRFQSHNHSSLHT
jgi:hypothetical protein